MCQAVGGPVPEVRMESDRLVRLVNQEGVVTKLVAEVTGLVEEVISPVAEATSLVGEILSLGAERTSLVEGVRSLLAEAPSLLVEITTRLVVTLILHNQVIHQSTFLWQNELEQE